MVSDVICCYKLKQNIIGSKHIIVPDATHPWDNFIIYECEASTLNRRRVIEYPEWITKSSRRNFRYSTQQSNQRIKQKCAEWVKFIACRMLSGVGFDSDQQTPKSLHLCKSFNSSVTSIWSSNYILFIVYS